MTIRKFPQLVFSTMNRFSNYNGGYYLDKSGQCFLVRNNTKIVFGNSQRLLGTVIMTNPGSYGLDKIMGWEQFKKGEGTETTVEGNGYADLTMQNIISVIQEAFDAVGKIPEGYLNIYNISSVVCPKGIISTEYHSVINDIITNNNMDLNLLENPIVKERDKFLQVCEISPFLIMGFVKNKFNEKVQTLLQWSENSRSRVLSLDKNGWPSHPRRWRTEPDLREKVRQKLIKLI